MVYLQTLVRDASEERDRIDARPESEYERNEGGGNVACAYA